MVSNIARKTDALSRQNVFQYDALNRLTTVIWKNSSGTAVQTLTYSFDADSHMLTAGNSNGSYTMTFGNAVLDEATLYALLEAIAEP